MKVTEYRNLLKSAQHKKNKYNAKKTTVDGITFDSAKESRRYQCLKLMEKAGEISGLELQPSFDIIVNGHKICRYVGDFRYKLKNGEEILEDSKGVRTSLYLLKKKLMKATYNIVIYET